MKRAVWVAMLGMVLHGNVHAVEPGVTAEPSLNKDSVVQSAPSVTKKKFLQGKKSKPSDKAGAIKVDAEAKKPGSPIETPRESADQSVQLRGVRG